jgi:hypothetical protein
MAPSTEGLTPDRVLYRSTRLTLVLSLGHHLDDLIRQHAVGWPLTSEVNAFTASLVVYPVTAAGPEAAGNLFRREGESWTISYEGAVVRLRDAKGPRHLAGLLTHPGREFHTTDLEAAEAQGDPARSQDRAAGEGLGLRPDLGDAGVLLDATAKAAHRARIEELRVELEEAEAFHDPARATKARPELELLVAELARAVGPGDRRAASHAERARLNATRAIRAAHGQPGSCQPAAGPASGPAVRTGRYCAYTPDPGTRSAGHADPLRRPAANNGAPRLNASVDKGSEGGSPDADRPETKPSEPAAIMGWGGLVGNDRPWANEGVRDASSCGYLVQPPAQADERASPRRHVEGGIVARTRGGPSRHGPAAVLWDGCCQAHRRGARRTTARRDSAAASQGGRP